MIRIAVVPFLLAAVAGNAAAAQPQWLKTRNYTATFAIRGTVRCAPACANTDADVRLVDRGGLDNARSSRRNEFAHVNLRTGAMFRFFAPYQWERDEVDGEAAASLASILVTVDRLGCQTAEREVRFSPTVPSDGVVRLNVGTIELDCRRAKP